MSKYAKFGSDDYLKLKESSSSTRSVKASRVETPSVKTMAAKKVVVPKTVKEVEEEVEVIEKIVKKPKKIIEKIVYVSDDEPEVIEKIVKKPKKLSPVPARSVKKQPEPEPEPVKTEREPHINPNTGKRSRRVLGGTEQAQAWNQQMLAIRRAKKEAALKALEDD